MHRQLYTHPDKLEQRHLQRDARDVGLDLERFDREMRDGTYRDLKDYYESMIHEITGTPTTFINGELYALSGPELLGVVKALVEK